MQSDETANSPQGDGVSGFYLGGAQLEPVSSSSYVPKTTAAGTRAADFLLATQPGWLNASEGTAFIDATVTGVAGGGVFLFSFDDGTDNGIGIYKVNGSGALSAYSGSAQGTGLGLVAADGQRVRAALAWSNGGASASASANGLAAVPVEGAGAVSTSEFCIGSARTKQFAGNLWAHAFTYWPQRMTDTQLAMLTAVPAT